MRLQKYLAGAGVGSRRTCEAMIAEGRVSVGGRVVAEMGLKVVPGRDEVRVDGRVVNPPDPRRAARTFLADKPRGVICTARDPQGRKTLLEWAREHGLPEGRFFSVGRLDYDSEGLILLTSDGALAQEWGHPSHGSRKVYRVWGSRPATAEDAHCWERGVREGGELLKAARVVREDGGRVCVVTLETGKNRQIRRMWEARGIQVRRLRRTRVGEFGEELLRGRVLREVIPSKRIPCAGP